jgi:hypothetical protein
MMRSAIAARSMVDRFLPPAFRPALALAPPLPAMAKNFQIFQTCVG